MKLRLDIKDAESVIRHPEIYPLVRDDGSPDADDFAIPGHYMALVGYIDEPIGCVMLHWSNSVCLEAHIQVLPEYRKDHAIEFGLQAIQWVWDNTPAHKIMATIPDIFPNVIEYAHTIGFELQGINEHSILKDGVLQNQFMMGLKRCQQQQQS